MVRKGRQRRCPYCGKLFIPDVRVGGRQKACSLACQRSRKKENNRSFRARNPEYWWGRYEEVKDWRQKHPDYQRQWRQARKQRRSAGEIQAERLRKAMEFSGKVYSYLCEIQAPMLAQPLNLLRQNHPLSSPGP
ncbi:MAG: hypothetical protein ACXWMO_13065 [Syntrophales bacterium]